jgi:hypothetical protein
MSPSPQVANIGTYDFGAPAAAGAPGDVVLVFRKKPGMGGKVTMTFVNPVDNPAGTLTVSAEVSEDGTSYAATTAANNLVAITAVALVSRQKRTFELLLRVDDAFLRIRASGALRGQLLFHGDELLDIVRI